MSGFTIAHIDDNGYIRIQGRGTWGDGVLHKGHEVGTDNTCYDLLDHAKQDWRGPASEELIVEYDENRRVVAFWFSEAQQEWGLTERLKIFSGCYGKTPIKIMKDE